MAANTAGESIRALVNCYVLVVVADSLAILLDLNGIRIENANRDMLPAEFDRAVGRRNPALKRRILAAIIHRDSEVGSLQRANSDTILFTRFSG